MRNLVEVRGSQSEDLSKEIRPPYIEIYVRWRSPTYFYVARLCFCLLDIILRRALAPRKFRPTGYDDVFFAGGKVFRTYNAEHAHVSEKSPERA